MNHQSDRNAAIIKCSLLGILMNIILFIAKIILAGTIRSQAIMLDALNGIADMFSASVAIVSVKAANRKADRNHPFGYGRLEYLLSLGITAFVLYTAVRAVIHSVDDLIHPGPAPDYSIISAVLMCVSFILKIIYGIHAKKVGTKVNSVALKLSGIESMYDSLISAIILGAMILFHFTGIVIEYWISLIFSGMLIKDGVLLAIDCMNKILGTRIDPEYMNTIRKIIISENKVLNTSNLIIHNYGESFSVGSVDIEVDEKMTAAEINRLTRTIKHKVREQGLVLTSVGITGSNTCDPRFLEITDTIIELAKKEAGIRRVQGITVDQESGLISFSVIFDGTAKEEYEAIEKIRDGLKGAFPDMNVEIETAIDF